MKYPESLVLVFVTIAFSCNTVDTKDTVILSTTPAEKPVTLMVMMEQATRDNKNLFLVFGFEGCAWCRRFDMYHHDQAVNEILSKYIIVFKVDYDKTPGGRELYRKYGGVGFPGWVIMDATGKVLIDNEVPEPGTVGRKYHVGYPRKQHTLDYYINCIKTVAPEITPKECSVLRERLVYYGEAG